MALMFDHDEKIVYCDELKKKKRRIKNKSLQNTYESVPFLYLKDALYIPLRSAAYSPENSDVITYMPLSIDDSNTITRNWFFSNLKRRLIGIESEILGN